jgi:hypothetical protein
MGWKIDDFACLSCEIVFEEMYKDVLEVKCPLCDNEVEKILSATNIAAFSIMSPEQKRDSLMRRSAKHTQKEIDKNPEKWGREGIERASKKIQVGCSGEDD